MKQSAESRKKNMMAIGLGAVALCCAIFAYSQLFGFGSSAPPPQAAPVIHTASPAHTESSSSSSGSNGRTAQNAIAGVNAQKLASASGGLDPTLDQVAMLRAESLEYAGSGRNIFSATYTPPPPPMPKNIPSARPSQQQAVVLPTAPTGPPPPPPINLKYFGTMKKADGKLQGFFLSGEDVYLAQEGEIVARKYKIKSLSANTASVEDLQYNNTQPLPLQH
ncbi:MAG: hypothetical protein PW735_04380 [Acidobacteriaceae bacterium]|nr:hypothetical protein [Acidobacteriaceae bacterium]